MDRFPEINHAKEFKQILKHLDDAKYFSSDSNKGARSIKSRCYTVQNLIHDCLVYELYPTSKHERLLLKSITKCLDKNLIKDTKSISLICDLKSYYQKHLLSDSCDELGDFVDPLISHLLKTYGNNREQRLNILEKARQTAKTAIIDDPTLDADFKIQYLKQMTVPYIKYSFIAV